MAYLRKVGSNWHAELTHHGKTFRQTMETGDRSLAKRRATAWEEKIKAEKWDALGALRPAAAQATVGTLVELYRKAAQVAPRTMQNNVLALQKVLSLGAGIADTLGASLEALTGELVRDYETAMVRKAGDNPLKQDRARRSAASMIRQARSVFTGELLLRYEAAGIKLPNLIPFLKVRVRAPAFLYSPPPPALVDRTVAAAQELKQQGRNDLYTVFLLAIGLGMRVREIVCARWDWIETQDLPRSRQMAITKRADFRPKGRERRVAIPEELYAELLEVGAGARGAAGPTGQICHGSSPSAAMQHIRRHYNRWFRSLGWDKDLYTKCSHELRRVFGSRIYTRISPAAAQMALGHVSIATTCQHYGVYDQLLQSTQIAGALDGLIPRAPAAQGAQNGEVRHG